MSVRTSPSVSSRVPRIRTTWTTISRRASAQRSKCLGEPLVVLVAIVNMRRHPDPPPRGGRPRDHRDLDREAVEEMRLKVVGAIGELDGRERPDHHFRARRRRRRRLTLELVAEGTLVVETALGHAPNEP